MKAASGTITADTMTSCFTNADRGYNASAVSVEMGEYNPEKAAEILEADGWVLNSDGVREKNGTLLHTELMVTSGDPVAPGQNSAFLLGTDQLGRDFLTRCIYGGRISLSVGLVSVAISLLIGIPLGSIAGYYGGVADMLIMRLTELFSCIPTFFLILTVNAAVKKPSIFYVMIIIGVFGWTSTCRQVRAQFLSLSRQEFVQSASSLGFKDARVIFRHVLPNALMPVIVGATMQIAGAIMTESSLSYLGLGVQEPIPSWGAMLKAGSGFLRDAPHMAIIPGILILIVTLSLNSIGDGLRDALDPRITRR